MSSRSAQSVSYCGVCGESLARGNHIKCTNCSKRKHTSCAGIELFEIHDFDRWYCEECTQSGATSKRRIAMNDHRHDRREIIGIPDVEIGTPRFVSSARVSSLTMSGDIVKCITVISLTRDYLIKNGFESPIVVKEPRNLGEVFANGFHWDDLLIHYSGERVIDVIESRVQMGFAMKLSKFVQELNVFNGYRNHTLNSLSLKVSLSSSLQTLAKEPSVVA